MGKITKFKDKSIVKFHCPDCFEDTWIIYGPYGHPEKIKKLECVNCGRIVPNIAETPITSHNSNYTKCLTCIKFCSRKEIFDKYYKKCRLK